MPRTHIRDSHLPPIGCYIIYRYSGIVFLVFGSHLSILETVFVSSPRFWNRFSFECVCTDEINLFQRAQAQVELCIERTKEHPFSFKFMAAFYPNIKPLSPLLENLVAHADRWRRACPIADENVLEKLLTKAKGRFRRLHSLQITPCGHTFSRTASDLFQDAPNLGTRSLPATLVKLSCAPCL